MLLKCQSDCYGEIKSKHKASSDLIGWVVTCDTNNNHILDNSYGYSLTWLLEQWNICGADWVLVVTWLRALNMYINYLIKIVLGEVNKNKKV